MLVRGLYRDFLCFGAVLISQEITENQLRVITVDKAVAEVVSVSRQHNWYNYHKITLTEA